MNIAIIGYGTVGKNLYNEIQSLHPDIYDKYLHLDNRKRIYTEGPLPPYYTREYIKYDIAFICVDTPLKDDKYLDTTEIDNAVNETEADIYVIKSTVHVGFCYLLSMSTGKKIVYSPEYYGGTPHCNNFDFNFTILGGNRDACIAVQQVLQNCYDARHSFRITDSKTAELLKLMENSWLATKVSFCTQFYELAEYFSLDYEELRELFVLDPRVNPSHTFVYRDHPYWDTHCLNKDVTHLAKTSNAEFLQSVVDFNNNQKEKYKGND